MADVLDELRHFFFFRISSNRNGTTMLQADETLRRIIQVFNQQLAVKGKFVSL